MLNEPKYICSTLDCYFGDPTTFSGGNICAKCWKYILDNNSDIELYNAVLSPGE